MKVRCVAEWPSEIALAGLGPDFYETQEFGVRVGDMYDVLGLLITNRSPYGAGVWVWHATDQGQLGHSPLALFSIVDSRVRPSWIVGLEEGTGDLHIAPPPLHDPDFMFRYYEGEVEATRQFEELVRTGSSDR